MFGDDQRNATTYTLPAPAREWDSEPAYGEPRPQRSPFAS